MRARRHNARARQLRADRVHGPLAPLAQRRGQRGIGHDVPVGPDRRAVGRRHRLAVPVAVARPMPGAAACRSSSTSMATRWTSQTRGSRIGRITGSIGPAAPDEPDDPCEDGSSSAPRATSSTTAPRRWISRREALPRPRQRAQHRHDWGCDHQPRSGFAERRRTVDLPRALRRRRLVRAHCRRARAPRRSDAQRTPNWS